jgi:hypothetical protein
MEGTTNLFINITNGTNTYTVHRKKVVQKVKRITRIDCNRSVLIQWPLQLHVSVQRLDTILIFIESVKYACSR